MYSFGFTLYITLCVDHEDIMKKKVKTFCAVAVRYFFVYIIISHKTFNVITVKYDIALTSFLLVLCRQTKIY